MPFVDPSVLACTLRIVSPEVGAFVPSAHKASEPLLALVMVAQSSGFPLNAKLSESHIEFGSVAGVTVPSK